MLSCSRCLHLSASLPLFTPFLKTITCNLMQITLHSHSLCIPFEWITIIVGLFIWCFVNCIFKWHEDYKLHIWGGNGKKQLWPVLRYCTKLLVGRIEETHNTACLEKSSLAMIWIQDLLICMYVWYNNTSTHHIFVMYK